VVVVDAVHALLVAVQREVRRVGAELPYLESILWFSFGRNCKKKEKHFAEINFKFWPKVLESVFFH
jgi:hypothetical protein